MNIFILQEEFYNYLDEEKEIDTPEEQTYQASDKTKLLLRLVLLSNLPLYIENEFCHQANSGIIERLLMAPPCETWLSR